MMKNILVFLLLGSASFTVFSAPKTVTLDVSSMNCVTCPYTVKLSLNKVEGVSETIVDFDSKEAVVSFDDQTTTVNALLQATTDAGYPSTLKEEELVE